MKRDLIINFTPTGMIPMRDTTPKVPIACHQIIDQVLEANPEPVEKYLGGKEGLFGWLVGQVMKETKGQANASVVNQIMRARLEAMRK